MGVPFFDALVRGESPRPVAPNYHVRNSISPGLESVPGRDGRTDGQTDGQREFP